MSSYSTKVRYRSLAFLGFFKYCVGDDGSVWTRYKSRLGWNSEWKKLKPITTKAGYSVVCQHNKQKKKERYYVHILVLTAFVGPCPEKMEACHFPDRDPSNNYLNNLRWATHSENERDKEFHGSGNQGDRHGRATLSNDQATEILHLCRTTKLSDLDIARMKGTDRGIVRFIRIRKTWKCLD